MPTPVIVLIVVVAVLAVAFIILYFLGKRAQKKRDEQQIQIDRAAQPVSMLIIDKKRLPLKKSGLPGEIIAKTPFYLKFSKVPIVKAKVGQRMATLICDPEVFKMIPVKKEVKAMLSGMYISGVKGLHGKIETPVKKQGFLSRVFMGRRY